MSARLSRSTPLPRVDEDMTFRGDTPYFMEATRPPGIRRLLEGTRLNAADAVVEYAIATMNTGSSKAP